MKGRLFLPGDIVGFLSPGIEEEYILFEVLENKGVFDSEDYLGSQSTNHAIKLKTLNSSKYSISTWFHTTFTHIGASQLIL